MFFPRLHPNRGTYVTCSGFSIKKHKQRSFPPEISFSFASKLDEYFPNKADILGRKGSVCANSDNSV